MTTSLLSRLACRLAGHDYTIKRAGGRMVLFCTACGHRSDGILLTGRPTTAAEGLTRDASTTGRGLAGVPKTPLASR